MNILLIFFALPIATIIISIALQKILKCPPLVAGIIFAIFLVVTFVINNLNFLIATIVYTIISFITAIIVCFICRLIERFRENNGNNCCRRQNCGNNESDNDLITLNSSCANSNNNGVTARINVIPNSNGNGTGQICGCYRRK